MKESHPIVNFSLRKEIFFVSIGSIIGAFTMHLPRIFLDLIGDASYKVTLLVLAQTVNSEDPFVGFLLHVFVATTIGIVTGIFLYKLIKFNISSIVKGITFGLIAGVIVFIVFAIPVSQLLLSHNTAQVLAQINPQISLADAANEVEKNFIPQMINSLAIHLIWGVTLGIIASLFTQKMGANYLCKKCNIEFSKIKTWKHHQEHVHDNPSESIKKILIVGGGYAGVGVLERVQKQFQDDVNVSISLVSESNFFLHTPMLPEMATGTIEPRHIATPIRKFCKRAQFYQAKVVSIELEANKIVIQRQNDSKKTELYYDYMVLASGSKTNFFGNGNIEKNSLTIKSLDDAIRIRDHIINVLETADQESDDIVRQKLVTFVVVGGGFSGVETVGELNEFVRESAAKYYRNIPAESIKVILVASGQAILPEIGNLGQYAKDTLEKTKVRILVNTRLDDYADELATLNNGEKIPCATLIWAGGNKVDDVIANINTEHHKSGRLVVTPQLQLENYPNVFALGDCAFVIDPQSQKPYPPTAQHAIRQAKTVSKNLSNVINGIKAQSDFVYDSKGSMAKIGKKDGVALLLGHELRGFAAWFVWKQYYLSTLPTTEKKIRVGLDWFIDLFFPRDIAQLSNTFEEKNSTYG